MNNLYIVVKEYNKSLSARQPWYTIKKIIFDFKVRGIRVDVVSDYSRIPVDFSGTVIKVFSFSDLFKRNRSNFKLIYLVTFPIYDSGKFFSIPFETIIENWPNLKRIFVFSLLPVFLKKFTLSKADIVLVISDRSEKYLEKFISVQKYIPFIKDNWKGTHYRKQKSSSKTIGYFGPPFSTRSFDNVVSFFLWLNKEGFNYKQKIITRIERDELKNIEKKYLSKIENNKNLKVVSGFLNRDLLAEELEEIDILILPFKVVMSELPIVVLEALELGIPVVTTTDCGIERISKEQKNILILKDFEKDKYNQVVDFIESVESDDFHQIQKSIDKINKDTLSLICQK